MIEADDSPSCEPDAGGRGRSQCRALYDGQSAPARLVTDTARRKRAASEFGRLPPDRTDSIGHKARRRILEQATVGPAAQASTIQRILSWISENLPLRIR